MSIPQWLQETLDAFGRSAGLPGLSFSARGTAAFRFENGVRMQFEYVQEMLSVLIAVPMRNDFESATALLTAAHPEYRLFRSVRAAYSERLGCGVFTVRLEHSEISLPELERVFQVLWRLSEDMRGRGM